MSLLTQLLIWAFAALESRAQTVTSLSAGTASAGGSLPDVTSLAWSWGPACDSMLEACSLASTKIEPCVTLKGEAQTSCACQKDIFTAQHSCLYVWPKECLDEQAFSNQLGAMEWWYTTCAAGREIYASVYGQVSCSLCGRIAGGVGS